MEEPMLGGNKGNRLLRFVQTVEEKWQQPWFAIHLIEFHVIYIIHIHTTSVPKLLFVCLLFIHLAI